MGDQDQQNGKGQSDQQNQTDGQSQSNAQTPPVAKQASPAAMAAAGLATDGGQGRGDGQSSAADSQSDTGQSSTTQQTHSAGSGQAQTPGLQAGAYRLSLTEAQRKKLVDEGVLDLSEEQYTGGVRHQIESLRKRATTAEKRLSDIAAAQAEADRKALEEQARYKELYEKERQGREAESAGRKSDAIRTRFLLAATVSAETHPISRCRAYPAEPVKRRPLGTPWT